VLELDCERFAIGKFHEAQKRKHGLHDLKESSMAAPINLQKLIVIDTEYRA
jgi:hypothetical protein